MKKKISKKQPKRTSVSLKPRRIKVKVIGIGGGAASILDEIANKLKGVSFLTADTDQRSFKKISSRVKVFQFGQELTRGWGTGMNPELGEKAAQSVQEKIRKIFKDVDLTILISCLGGGISSGAGLVFARTLKQEKKLSLGIFTLPFSFEGEKKAKLAKSSLENLRENLSGVIVLPNEEILKHTEKKTSLKKSLSLMNQVLIDYLGDLIEMISSPGIINIDFADFLTILKGKGQTVCFGRGVAGGQEQNRTDEVLKGLFENPFFISSSKIKKILFNISGGADLELKEVEKIAEEISKLNPKAKIIFGISRNPKLGKKIKLTFLGVGEEEKKSQNKEEKKNSKKTKKRERTRPKKKIKIRKSALEVKKTEQEAEEKEWSRESDLEIPAFLRRKIK